MRTRAAAVTLGLAVGGALLLAGCQQGAVEQAGMSPPSSAVALHAMSLDEAAELTRTFRDANPAGTELAGYFDRAVMDQILSEPGVVGLRIYNGTKADGMPALVVVGVDSQGNDLVSGTIAEKHRPCPPFCGDGVSPLGN